VSRHDLLRAPQHVGYDESWWFYEEGRGLVIVVEPLVPRSAPTRTVVIPWLRIRAALKRKDRKP
jgi:hypothetical protein